MPAKGVPAASLLDEMRSLRNEDADWHNGRTWSLVYHVNDEVTAFLKEAQNLYLEVNGLNLSTFPSLRKFETEVVAMASRLLGGGDEARGSLTSGGTESILMALKTARSWAKENRPAVAKPEVVAPISVHPAFDKACDYLGLNMVHTPVRGDFRADVDAVRNAVNANTILIVGSAPSYPQGVVDPIPELAQIAAEQGILMHVDACVGGFMLPFLHKIGHPVPEFDFRVPGVTSISADIHKYGYSAKGASIILHRNADLRRHQFFVYTGWTGGIYASAAAAGTRPGGSIAAAWAIMRHLGEEGYCALARQTLESTQRLIHGINAIEGLRVLGQPDMTIFSFTSEKADIYAIGDEMTLKGWHMDRQQNPACLHLTVMAHHHKVVDAFLADLAESVRLASRLSLANIGRRISFTLTKAMMRLLPDSVVSKMAVAQSKKGGNEALPKRTAAIYGMMGELPDQGDLDVLVSNLLDKLHTPINEGSSAARR